MAKPLIEIIGVERAKEIMANVKEELGPHLEYLIRNIDVELGVSPPALRLNNEVVYIRDPKDLDLFLDRLLLRSGYIVEHRISGNDLGLLVYHLANIVSQVLVAQEEELTWQGEGVKYVIEATDGVVAPVHGFIFNYGLELIASDIVYAAVTKQLTDSRGNVKEVKTVEPFLVYAIFRNGIIVDRGYEPPLAYKEEPLMFNVSGRIVRVEVKTVGKTMLQTLMTTETLRRFVKGEVSKPFPEIFRMVKEKLMKYVNFSWDPRLYDVVSCYIIGTYFYDMFPAYPRIHFAGPFGSGKTRAMLTTVYMCRHGYAILSPTEASNYRSIEAYGPTIGIDEKTFTKEFETLVAAGYKRSGKVPRVAKTVKEKFILELFGVYAPVVFSTVEELSENLKQKTIIVTMQIAEDPNPEHRDPEPWDLEDVREELYLARLTRAWEVYEAMRSLKIPELKGRAFELWFPLLVMAKLSGEEVYKSVFSYALEDTGKRFEELYAQEKQLLQAIERLVLREVASQDRLFIEEDFLVTFTPTEVLDTLEEILVIENKELSKRSFEKLWNATKVGLRLRRSFKLEKTKSQGRSVYRINVKKFLELCSTFGYTPSENLKDLVKQKSNQLNEGTREGREPFLETPASQTPSEKPSEHLQTPSDRTPEVSQKRSPRSPGSLNGELKNAILKILGTQAVASGLKDRDIYKVLAELQKHGKLKVMVTYDIVKKALEELRKEGKVQEENGSWKLAQ